MKKWIKEISNNDYWDGKNHIRKLEEWEVKANAERFKNDI